MSQEVLCPNPSCGKKYRLQGEIPAEFTCTKCGQTMDLSAFAPAPAPKQTGAPSTRSARRGGSTRGSRSRREPEEEEDEGRARFQPPPKSNAGLIWAGVGVLLLLFVLVYAVVTNKATEDERNAAKLAGTPGTAPGVPLTPGLPTPAGDVVPGGLQPSAVVPGMTPAVPGPSGPPDPAPPPSSTRLSSIALRVWDPPAELNVTADEKERIERALDTALNDTGRAVQEAQAVLVGLGRKSIWRVVSQFKHIQDTDTFEKRPGLVKAMVVDRILRSIDGYLERSLKVLDRINPESSPDWATNVARRWNSWLEKGAWKNEQKPWDPRVDMQDEAGDVPTPRSGAGGGR